MNERGEDYKHEGLFWLKICGDLWLVRFLVVKILNFTRTWVFLRSAGSICVLTNMNVLLRRCNTVKARIFATRSGFVQTRNFGFFGKKPDNEDKIQLKKYIDGDASVALDRRRRRETIESRFPPLTSVPKEIAETLSTQPLEPPKYVLFLLKLKDAILMGCQGLKSPLCQTVRVSVQKRTTACRVPLHFSSTRALDLNSRTTTAYHI